MEMKIEIPTTFQELNLWSDSIAVARQIEEIDGKSALVSIVYPVGSKEVYHPDGVYELATLRRGDNHSPFIAEILAEIGETKRIGFSLEELAGLFLSGNNGDRISLDEHPGRFRRIKIKGEYSTPVKEFLGTQIGKLALIDSKQNPRSGGKYYPTIIDDIIEPDFYRATVKTSVGANTGIYHCEDVLGILALEKNLPTQLLGRTYPLVC